MILRCGGGEIRTRDTLSDVSVFKTDALDHSATPPVQSMVPEIAHYANIFRFHVTIQLCVFWRLILG